MDYSYFIEESNCPQPSRNRAGSAACLLRIPGYCRLVFRPLSPEIHLTGQPPSFPLSGTALDSCQMEGRNKLEDVANLSKNTIFVIFNISNQHNKIVKYYVKNAYKNLLYYKLRINNFILLK